MGEGGLGTIIIEEAVRDIKNAVEQGRSISSIIKKSSRKDLLSFNIDSSEFMVI